MKANRSLWLKAALVGGLVSSVALAQEETDIQIGGEEIDIVTPAEDPETMPPFSVRLQGGLSGYTGELGDATAVGPLFGVIVSTEAARAEGLGQVTPNLRVEAQYDGNANSIDDSFGEDGAVWRHNISTLAKAGVQIQQFNPFVGIGVGASYFNANDDAVNAGFRDDDLAAEFPLAAGVEANFGNLSAGIRGTYHLMAGEELTENLPGLEDSNGNMLSGSLTLGGRF